MMKVLFALKADLRPAMFVPEDLDRIAAVCDVMDVPPPKNADKEFLLRHASDADIIVTSWHTAPIDADVVAAARCLRLVAHAAGSVKPVVSEELWERGVRVVSAAAAIARGVAEYTLGLILTAPKRVFWAALATREGKWKPDALAAFGGAFEIYRQNIGIVGAGFVGREVIRLLRNFECHVLLYDPYVSESEAAEMGAEKVASLDEMFSRCRVVSVHAPSTERTRHMIRGRHFAMLPDGAVFINTARGAVVHQGEMIEELRKGRFVACLDVTDPEPPPPDDPIRKLPNVLLTPHEAGAVGENMARIGTLVADEIERFARGEGLQFEVRREDLSRLA